MYIKELSSPLREIIRRVLDDTHQVGIYLKETGEIFRFHYDREKIRQVGNAEGIAIGNLGGFAYVLGYEHIETEERTIIPAYMRPQVKRVLWVYEEQSGKFVGTIKNSVDIEVDNAYIESV